MATSSDTAPAEMADCIHVDGTEHKVVDVGSGGNVILEVLFENTKACTKSIPNEMIQKLRTSKTPFPSARVFYRVRLDTLKKHSKYFGHLLGSDVFEEGRAISAKFTELSLSGKDASKLPAEELPKIQIKDEDYATRTIGRETVFHDMLRMIHGMDHSSKSITLLYIAILVVMADRYDCMATIARYITGRFSNFRYPPTLEKTTEEVISFGRKHMMVMLSSLLTCYDNAQVIRLIKIMVIVVYVVNYSLPWTISKNVWMLASASRSNYGKQRDPPRLGFLVLRQTTAASKKHSLWEAKQ
ncbi:hypothetical protein SS1G_00456 [Sclerotinia sclerotiorum 1980 UF-70]|uniref:BTB domain-containing protein n=1 Tax=Sclerotinia sclerotiorum (strain ATCC 18683 / 1980 / Ss-1) TaxID=665079 RepID=A7E582_SCLS1|nr:hypothetical protein SS1G_00456 [Sclerotinia sclerotiorum 1980 UF-70]EDN91054.1 hypothetical protein SS1G_00456 [Sclerotinia sclerotiorum 1980 UF-70]